MLVYRLYTIGCHREAASPARSVFVSWPDGRDEYGVVFADRGSPGSPVGRRLPYSLSVSSARTMVQAMIEVD